MDNKQVKEAILKERKVVVDAISTVQFTYSGEEYPPHVKGIMVKLQANLSKIDGMLKELEGR